MLARLEAAASPAQTDNHHQLVNYEVPISITLHANSKWKINKIMRRHAGATPAAACMVTVFVRQTYFCAEAGNTSPVNLFISHQA